MKPKARKANIDSIGVLKVDGATLTTSSHAVPDNLVSTGRTADLHYSKESGLRMTNNHSNLFWKDLDSLESEVLVTQNTVKSLLERLVAFEKPPAPELIKDDYSCATDCKAPIQDQLHRICKNVYDIRLAVETFNKNSIL